MERLTFEGNFCDIAQCSEVPGGSFCEDAIGRTVFLTEEEAEKALQEMEGKKDG